MAIQQCKWSEWVFNVYSQNSGWNDVPGVYIFAKQTGLMQRWSAVYIGQTGSFADRLPHHEKWNRARELGATHIHARKVVSIKARLHMENQLIALNRPQLN